MTDFIIDDHTAVEVKAKENMCPNDMKPLRMPEVEKKLKRKIRDWAEKE